MTRPRALAIAAAGTATLAVLVASGCRAPRHALAGSTSTPATSAVSERASVLLQLPTIGVVTRARRSEDVVATAERFVMAMWTRAPGEPTLGWLDTVADITDPALAAELRASRPTLGESTTVSSSVEIDGAYPDALDPLRVTVTCVAHLVTTAGRSDEPCAGTATQSRRRKLPPLPA